MGLFTQLVAQARGVYTYRTCCVESTGRAINNMVDNSKDISRATFLKYADRESLKAVEASLGYDDHHAKGLTMAGDWHVTYSRSKYRGRDCVYFTQSAIEFIFY